MYRKDGLTDGRIVIPFAWRRQRIIDRSAKCATVLRTVTKTPTEKSAPEIKQNFSGNARDPATRTILTIGKRSLSWSHLSIMTALNPSARIWNHRARSARANRLGKWVSGRFQATNYWLRLFVFFPNRDCQYNFVDPREFDIDTEFPCGEEETPEYSPIKCRPCLIGDEVESEEEQAEPDVECTLAIIKPEAISCRDEIEDRIIEEGFEIYQTRWLQLTPEQTSDFYADCYGRTNFALLVAYMSSAPVIAMVLAKHRAVEDWRHVMGPTKVTAAKRIAPISWLITVLQVTEARLYFPDSIRARFGRRGEDFENAVHGSANREQAEREIRFFFPGSEFSVKRRG